MRVDIHRQPQVGRQFELGQPFRKGGLQGGGFLGLDQQAHAVATNPFLIAGGAARVDRGTVDDLLEREGAGAARGVFGAEQALRRCMEERAFGEAGTRVVVEEFLVGIECSIHAFVDGRSHLLCPDARDHKKAFDGDNGPNTGGMGTISPCGSIDATLRETIQTEVLDRFITGIKKDGIAYRGMLFPGLMLTKDGLKVLEFNCRWGDPETQVLVRRLKSDLLPVLEATVDGKLDSITPEWDNDAAICLILASGGYPGSYEKGKAINAAETLEFDEVIDPVETRLRIVTALECYQNKNQSSSNSRFIDSW